MHILLTDLLTCPRCGPEFGLVVLADELRDRRVLAGSLGCPNCRESYPIREGVADLRLARGDAVPAAPEPADAEAATRLAALLGLAQASGMVLVAGPGAADAAGIARLVPGVEVIAVGSAALPAAGAGVSPLRTEAALPLRPGMLRGAALTGAADEASLREALRVLAPGARVLVHPAREDAAAQLAALGAEVLLDQDGAVVARAPGRPVALRHNAIR